MKTDKEIFDDFCYKTGIGPINSIYHMRMIENTYRFMTYHLSIRWSEFIDVLINSVKKVF